MMEPPPADVTRRDAEAAEDRALMARLQCGDETAFAALMERWELPTKAVIARLVLNAHEAEELAQETFVRVWQQRARFREGAEFRPWLFAIAINLARNRLRWWRRRPTVSLQEWETRGAAEAVESLLPATAVAAGARALEQAERAAEVRAAVASLPHDLREALILFEYEQLSQAEIGKIVGATAKAVETRIHRAKEKMRKALAGLRAP